MRLNRRKIAQDAALVEEHARIIINVDDRGNPLNMIERKLRGKNPTWGMNILAVVGPLTHEGTRLPHAVWFEVGMGRARPYHLAEVPRVRQTPGERKCIRRRNNPVKPSYLHIARVFPTVIDQLVRVSSEQIATWTSGATWCVKMPRRFLRRSARRYTVGTTMRDVPRGVYFSVSDKDPVLRHMVFATDVDKNYLALQGLARSLRMGLKGLKMSYYTERQLRAHVRQSSGGLASIVDRLSDPRLPPHRLAAVLFSERFLIS